MTLRWGAIGTVVGVCVLLMVLAASPVAGHGADPEQLAKVRAAIGGLGYGEPKVNDFGAPGLDSLTPPACQQIPLQSGSPPAPTVLGSSLSIDDNPNGPEPGQSRLTITVSLFATEWIECADAWAKQQYDYISKRSSWWRDAEQYAVGGMPAVAAVDAMRSKIDATRGAKIYSVGGGGGTLSCGNIRVDVSYELMDAQGDRNAHEELAQKGKQEARQRLTAIGQALLNANVCSGSWQSAASPAPAGFTVGLGCQYSAADGVLCSARTSDQPAGAGPNDITFGWTWDGTPDSRTTTDTYARPDAEITPGDHTLTVHAIDTRTNTPSSSTRWAFTKPGEPGASGATAPATTGTPAASPAFGLTVGCEKLSEDTSHPAVELAVVCEAKPAGAPADAQPTYTWSWDGQPVSGAQGPFLTSRTIAPNDFATHPVAVRAVDAKSGVASPVATTTVARSRQSPLAFISPETWTAVNTLVTGDPNPTPPDPATTSDGAILVSVLLGTAAAAATTLFPGAGAALTGVAGGKSGGRGPGRGQRGSRTTGGAAQVAPASTALPVAAPSTGAAQAAAPPGGATQPAPAATPRGGAVAPAAAPPGGTTQPAATPPAGAAGTAGQPASGTSPAEDVLIGAQTIGDPFAVLDGAADTQTLSPVEQAGRDQDRATQDARGSVETFVDLGTGLEFDHVDPGVALQVDAERRHQASHAAGGSGGSRP